MEDNLLKKLTQIKRHLNDGNYNRCSDEIDDLIDSIIDGTISVDDHFAILSHEDDEDNERDYYLDDEDYSKEDYYN